MRRCYVIDIDGTIADLTHRLPLIQKHPKDWDTFFARVSLDLPVDHMRQLLYHLDMGQFPAMPEHRAGFVYVSGRREQCRTDTISWLEKHAFPKPAALYMRANGDFRDDSIVKGELLDQLLGDGFAPILAFDDRSRVVEMWRSRGIPCAQVREGDF